MKSDTRTLLKLTGMRDQLRRTLIQTFSGLGASTLTPTFLARLGEIEELTGQCFERHFTEAEIKSLIKFYNSPLGRALVDKMPPLLEELEDLGRELGWRIARESLGEL